MNYNNLPKLTSNYEACVRGLVLAITAPTKAKCKMASELAESCAVGLSTKEIKKAKKAALAYIAANS